jgi:hypothetical protein
MSGTPDVGGREDELLFLNNTFTCHTAIKRRDILYVPAERSEVRLLLRMLQSCFLDGSWPVTSFGETNAP